jgi:cytochrome c-type biogenesis protein CcmH/NrfG
LSDIDRRRSLGLGYLEVANRAKVPEKIDHYRERALGLLSAVREEGLRDPVLDASLARLRFDMRLDQVEAHAAAALERPDCAGQDRCNALFLLAEARAGEGRHGEARGALRQLTRLRRHAVDWLLLADCEKALGHDAAMIEALTTATRIDPRQWKAHRHLAEHHRRQGDEKKADWHRRRAVE